MLRPVQIAVLAAIACLQPIGPAANAARPQASFSLQATQPVRDWMPDGSSGLYIQDRDLNWYHASLAGACPDLDSKHKIGFISVDGGRFDRSSSIMVGKRQCSVKSIVSSARPIMEYRDE